MDFKQKHGQLSKSDERDTSKNNCFRRERLPKGE